MESIIDAEVLISLIEAKPVLWDKTLDIYKDRIATRNAWEEVCSALKPDFDSISDTEKNAFGKEVSRKWTNLRDCFAKSKKGDKIIKKGSHAKKRKKYVFSDQLQFLNKIYTNKDTVNSFDSKPGLGYTLEDVKPGGSGMEDTSFSTNVDLPSNKSSSQTGKRRHKKPEEIELKVLKAVEPKTPSYTMSFFQSLMPHLNNFTEKEFLQFQMGVLKVIENINKMKDAS